MEQEAMRKLEVNKRNEESIGMQYHEILNPKVTVISRNRDVLYGENIWRFKIILKDATPITRGLQETFDQTSNGRSVAISYNNKSCWLIAGDRASI